MTKKLIFLELEVMKILQMLNDKGCQCLVIGGAVRDAILEIEPKDIDIEVYNISVSDLTDILSKYGKTDVVGKKFGITVFTPFGSSMKYDFSVPRKENRVGVGHKDFEVTFDINMTIQEAASRRDFTFNALAYDPITHVLYDYYGGVDDLKNGILRHTTEKFTEDALRVLRAMQFQARFNLTIHPDTISLMKEMMETTDFNELSKERVFDEWMKWAEKGVRHDLIFKFMRDTNLINHYPMLKALKETPQDAIYHPEGDVEIHTELCLNHLDKILNHNLSVPYKLPLTGANKVILVIATLLHDIAKPKTTEEKIKKGRLTITSEGHEEMGGVMAKEFLDAIKFPEALTTPICNIIANHLAGVNISMIPAPSGKIKAIKKLSRKLFPATIGQLLYVMDSDTNGRGGNELKVPTGFVELLHHADDLNVIEKPYEFILMGRHLIEAGLKPSPDFKRILDLSHEAQINGQFNDVDGAKEWLSKLLVLTN